MPLFELPDVPPPVMDEAKVCPHPVDTWMPNSALAPLAKVIVDGTLESFLWTWVLFTALCSSLCFRQGWEHGYWRRPWTLSSLTEGTFRGAVLKRG